MYLLLNEVLIANNSQVLIDEIGEGDNEALLCLTDFHHFNDDNTSLEVGNWYYPNKSLVETRGDIIYISRGDEVVRLHRTKNVITPTGMFRCEIPDANGTFQNIFVDLDHQIDDVIHQIDETTVIVSMVSDYYPSSPNLAAISAGVVVSVLLLIAVGVAIISVIIISRYCK